MEYERVDQILLNKPQYEAIQKIKESYNRINKSISDKEAYEIWIKRGMPQ